MRNQIQSGSTDWNNTQRLGEGELTFDEEAKALRVHNGSALGGLELPGIQAFKVPGPGPVQPVVGDTTQGFYGEVSQSEVTTGPALASLIGLSSGTDYNSGIPWLKFALDGKTLFVSKKPLRYNLTWEQISAVNAVYGDLVVTLDDYQYKVRLLTGADTDPTALTSLSGTKQPETAPSEWDRLIYPVHADDPDGLGWGIGYSNSDINIKDGAGRASWCQESSTDGTKAVTRGLYNVVDLYMTTKTAVNTYFSWRPVLELMT